MRPEFCMICQDKKHFSYQVNQIRNIVSRLRVFTHNANIEENKEMQELKNALQLHHQHPHFMCGHCIKVNTNELHHLEDEMDELLLQIASIVEKKDRMYYDTLQLLRGTYSGKYTVFERYCKKKWSD